MSAERPSAGRPEMWRSHAELEAVPGFEEILAREFPQGIGDPGKGGMSKREFLKLAGASLALAGAGGLAGCRRPEAYMVPFTKGAEWAIPGKFLYYATSMPIRGGAMPLVASTVDGRPTKIEGNPLHPASNGATDAFTQASILDLYDPHRSKVFRKGGKETTRAHFAAFLGSLAAEKPAGLAFLVERKNSPTRDRLRQLVAGGFPGALWAEYEPLGSVPEDEATAACFGQSFRLLPKYERADVILALDSDFLNPSEHGPGAMAGFYPRRNPDQKGAPMNRLYAVENHFTTTGGLADHRLRCKASEVGEALRRIARRIASKSPAPMLAAALAEAPESAIPLDDAWLEACADDLAENAGRGILSVGGQQPPWVHALAHAANASLGNFGTTILGASTGEIPAATIGDLASAISAREISHLFIFGGNPAYNAPAEMGFAELISKVPVSVRLGLFEDETSALCTWHAPAAHYLESWGDTRAYEGTYSSIQPMILPLYGGVSELEVLAGLLGRPDPSGPELVRETFAGFVREPFGEDSGADESERWSAFLRDGFLPGTAFTAVRPPFNPAAAAGVCSKAAPVPTSGLELVFLQSSSVDDGRYANNSWLQETPDFETKVAWDNVALVSPATAKKLGIRENNFSPLYGAAQELNKLAPDKNLRTEPDFDIVADMVEISAGGRSIRAAAIVAPGHADDSVSIALGYGRVGVSAIMDGVGFDAYPLRESASPRFRAGISVRPVEETYALARTQEARSMHGRDLARQGTLALYAEDPQFARSAGTDGHLPPDISLYANPPLTAEEQWGMAIDLNTCTGCGACLLACQSENNVPVVGKEQVRKNRDMAWLRIDRYFAGDPENPEMLAQAVMCQHCENAPCEPVCPANATVHSEDGLNLMAYNRCIGTRYCANNCPWKVRRFNYFDYNERPLDKLYWGPLAKKGMADSLKLSKNPNVTVRMRGVMEKCTFCIQRIEEAKIARLVAAGPNDKSAFPLAEFQTACQQACPSASISFGDLNNPATRAARLRNSDRGYSTLAYLGTRPRVTYLARIRNPNPLMPENVL